MEGNQEPKSWMEELKKCPSETVDVDLFNEILSFEFSSESETENQSCDIDMTPTASPFESSISM